MTHKSRCKSLDARGYIINLIVRFVAFLMTFWLNLWFDITPNTRSIWGNSLQIFIYVAPEIFYSQRLVRDSCGGSIFFEWFTSDVLGRSRWTTPAAGSSNLSSTSDERHRNGPSNHHLRPSVALGEPYVENLISFWGALWHSFVWPVPPSISRSVVRDNIKIKRQAEAFDRPFLIK